MLLQGWETFPPPGPWLWAAGTVFPAGWLPRQHPPVHLSPCPDPISVVLGPGHRTVAPCCWALDPGVTHSLLAKTLVPEARDASALR